jgi:hypothetical protein
MEYLLGDQNRSCSLHALLVVESLGAVPSTTHAARDGTFRGMPTMGAQDRRMSELLLAVFASSRGSLRVQAVVRGRNQEAAATAFFGNSNSLQRPIKCSIGNLQEQVQFRRRTERPDGEPVNRMSKRLRPLDQLRNSRLGDA